MADLNPQSKKMTDVLPPQAMPGEGELPAILLKPTTQKEAIPEIQQSNQKKRFTPELRQASWIFASLIAVLLVGSVVMRFSALQDRVAHALAMAKQVASESVPFRALPELGTSALAEDGYQSISSASSTSFGLMLRKASLSDIWTLFTHGGEALDRFQKTVTQYGQLMGELNGFLNKTPNIFFSANEGPLPTLHRIQQQLAEFETTNNQLSASLGSVKGALPIDFSEYIALGKSLHRVSDFLNVGVRWLEKPHKIIIAFQNSSEMRPSGGFFGSYAEVTLDNGKVTDVTVRDVTEADEKFSESIVPPRPLQYIVKNWRAADANWFFDFPKSASQTLAFLEKSDLYRPSGTRFDGFIAISPRVLGDILDTTGPIEIKDKKLTLTAENFLEAIQNDVVSERVGSSTSPKSILGDIVLSIRERMLHLSAENRSQISQLMTDWVRYKDVQIFMRDENLQTAVRFFGADGSVASSSATQNTDYLALVDSTIGGEKTNRVVDRKITLRAQIETDGRVIHHLEITRTHKGNKETERWYKVPNRNYFRVLIPAGSKVAGASGFADRAAPTKSYGSDYSHDSASVNFESTFKDVLGMPTIKTFEESEKTGVAGWVITEAGKTSKTTLDYESRLAQKPDASSTPFRFIFEKQAGTEGNYNFEIDAPVGYHFKESQLPIFEYKTEDIPGRVVIDLTLEKT